MSEYSHVEKPFLDQLATLDWSVIDHGHGIVPNDPSVSLRTSFRQWLLPDVFCEAVRSINRTDDGTMWLTDRQLDDLRDQLVRQPNLGLWKRTKPSKRCCSRHKSMSTRSPGKKIRLSDSSTSSIRSGTSSMRSTSSGSTLPAV